MFEISTGWRNYGLLVLTSCVLVGISLKPARADDKALKGATFKVDDLKVTELKVSGKATLPCMLWVDPEGSAFLTLEGGTGILRRISYPDCNITKLKDFERKFAWISLSEYGVLLSETDTEEIWVVDPTTLEVKNKIAVPKLKRAVSAPGQNWAVACDRGRPMQDQKLYLVDLVQKKAEVWAAPMDSIGKIGLDNPVMTPDGTHVFAQGDLVNGHMCRFSFKDRKLTFEEAEEQIGDKRFMIGGFTPNNTAGITISSDSKFVCQVFPSTNTKTPIYPVDTFAKHQCILEHGEERDYPGFRRLPQYRPMAMGFDIKGGHIYTQDGGQEFTVFTLTGVKKKSYKLGVGSVWQYLVHPGGNHVVLLREASVGAGMGQMIHFDTVLVEVPKQK
ncbi:MAG TPA: hypothetical protein VG122_16380 [Gemmata sp.]|jgi:hypothetical protein|nr:hypothetical protein [Gemmata sp.]